MTPEALANKNTTTCGNESRSPVSQRLNEDDVSCRMAEEGVTFQVKINSQTLEVPARTTIRPWWTE